MLKLYFCRIYFPYGFFKLFHIKLQIDEDDELTICLWEKNFLGSDQTVHICERSYVTFPKCVEIKVKPDMHDYFQTQSSGLDRTKISLI